MTFKDAVEATPSIRGAYCKGLRALGADSAHVACRSPRRIAGSINLDEALKDERPNDPRWDYGIGHLPADAPSAERVFWIEVHPASASRHVNDVIAKARWLFGWLESESPSLKAMPGELVWVATGKVAFTPNGPERRRLAGSGVQVRFEPRRLELS